MTDNCIYGLARPLTRRSFLRLAGLSAAAAAIPARLAADDAKPAPKPLNVLWISIEDTSPNLGCYGDKYADTPNLDAFAAQGCRYTHAFSPYPVCAPTRSSVITGMYPSTIGSMHMRTGDKGYQCVPPPYVRCFTEYLRAAGYYCTNHTKTDYQFASPFTAWDPGKDWRDRPEGMPFFAVINLTITHESQNWPRKGEKLIHDPAKAPLPSYYPDTPIVRENIARCYDNITTMDKQAGEILARLKADGLEDNTVVFFWPDHGRGMTRCKRWLYDSGTRVPLMVRWPGKVKPGSVCDEFVMLTDLGPTVMSVAGLKVPAYMQGRAFLGEQKAPAPEFVVLARERMDVSSDEHIRAIRDKQYKYIRNFTPERPYAWPIPYRDRMPVMQELRRLHDEGKLNAVQELFFRKTKPVEELYDIAADPDEVNNLADSPKHQDVLKLMRSRLEKWIKDTHDLGGTPEDELIERMWPGKVQPVTAAPQIQPAPAGGGRTTLTITCPTEGASIGYQVDGGRWLPYTQPVAIGSSSQVVAKAIRIGYKTSDLAGWPNKPPPEAASEKPAKAAKRNQKAKSKQDSLPPTGATK
jgi:arylsulfatase A-like enzyme